ncbi:MAG: DEAD/DEAH box helicase [Thermoflexales bacterium]|nr:DEAD/DEAH box helicase [Thermoflexales bacterium]
MHFSDFKLHPQLARAITRAGYEAPTPIQVKAIPPALTGKDLIGTAQTGTGKTAAFVLPILDRLLRAPEKLGKSRALIITPTRELAEQIHTTVREFAEGSRIRSATIYGGVGMNPQEKALREGVEILVVCPGRLLDHIEQGTAVLKGIEVLVLDEADRMFDMGFLPSVRRIVERLPRERQTLLFSATFAPELQSLADQVTRRPERVDAGMGVVKTIAHALYPVPQSLKTGLLTHFLKTYMPYSVLVFTRTKHRANRVFTQLTKSGFTAGVLHSNKSQNQRQRALDDFRAGKLQVLVATDIAARGLDIEAVTHVVNYDIPDTVETYIHRIGRTGRAERDGDAMTLVTAEDNAMVRDIERALKAPIERKTLEGFDYAAVPEIAPAHPHAHAPAPRPPQAGPSVRKAPAFERGKSRWPGSNRRKGWR